MKKILLILTAIVLSISVSAQGNSGGKGKDKQKDKDNVLQNDNPGKSKNKDKEKDKEKEDKAKKDEHDRKVWDGIDDKNGSCMKPSKNQPAKVRSAFQRDYPNAINVSWTKCRGDWTATFANGLFRSTAVYHANGDRRDTRTPIGKNDLPRVILDSVFKRKPGINIGDIIKIELPGGLNEIFRIKTDTGTQPEFQFFNKLGELIKYDY